jgi:F-type H+-transporting ATPase subunit delta
MAAGTVAGVYATALLELASERGSYDAVVAACRELADAWPTEAIVSLDDPRVGRARAKDILRTLLANQPKELVDLMMLLVDRNRLADALAILDMVDDLDDATQGVVEVTVTAAAPLSDQAKVALTNQLKHRVKRGACELHEVVDPGLIGGYTLRVGDYYVDASVRRRLIELKAGILATPVNDGWWTGASA